MQRPALLVLTALIVVGAVLTWRSLQTPAGGATPGASRPEDGAAVQGELLSPPAGTVAPTDPPRERVDRPAPTTRCTVRGVVVADRQGPTLDGARVVAYRGLPGDSRSFFPGAAAGPAGMRYEPSFVLTGEPIASAPIGVGGTFELVAEAMHLRLVVDHDFYLLAMPEPVHVPPSGTLDGVVLTPLLGGLLRGRVLGSGAVEVAQVVLTADLDPMSVMRDPQLFLGAMASMVGRHATVEAGAFTFRGVLPRTPLHLAAESEVVVGNVEVAPLAGGEARDVVLAVRAGNELEVVVVDGDGRPIDGARVVVTSPDAGGSLVPQLRARRGVTAADGHAHFAGLRSGKANVEATAKERVAAYAEVVLPDAGPAPTVQLTLTEGGIVTGRVLGPDGAPLADARVAHHPQASFPIVGNIADQLGAEHLDRVAHGGVRTAADGSFRLGGLDDDGEFLVVATHGDFVANYREGVRMGDSGVDVQLRPQAALIGRVVRDDDGTPITDFEVGLHRTAFLVMRMPVRAEAVTGAADGAFRIDGVGSGDYSLRVTVPGLGDVEKSITVAGDVTDVGELRVQAAAWVSGTVVGADGAPVARALVRRRQGGMADNPMLAMFTGGDTTAHSDAAGRFRLGPLHPGRLQLVANATGHASGRSERLAVEPGVELRDVVIQLTAGGSIRGRLQTGPGQFVDDFLLMAQEQTTQASHGADIAADGTFVFEHLDPGQYVVQAMPNALMRGFGDTNWRPGQGMKLGEMMRKFTDSVVSQRCTVRDGETSEVVLDASEIDDGTRWTVRVEIGGRALPDGVLEAQDAQSGRVRVAMIEDGAAVFGQLPPRTYRLQARSGMTMTPVGTSQQVELPAGVSSHTTTLTLPGGELRGRVVDAERGEPLRTALVRLFHDGHAERDDAIGVALTGTDGTFSFAGLLPGRYTLVAADGPLGGTGAASRRSGIEVHDGAPAEPIELRAAAAASANVLVTTDGGTPIAGATVLCVDPEGRPLGAMGLAVSGADGVAWFGGLASGNARVVGRAPGFAPGASAVQEVGKDFAARFQLPLTRGARTSVRVYDRDGGSLAGATLTARCDGGPWLPAFLLEEGRGADGAIDVGRLGPGTWQVRVSHPRIGTVQVERTIGGEPNVTIVVAPQ